MKQHYGVYREFLRRPYSVCVIPHFKLLEHWFLDSSNVLVSFPSAVIRHSETKATERRKLYWGSWVRHSRQVMEHELGVAGHAAATVRMLKAVNVTQDPSS